MSTQAQFENWWKSEGLGISPTKDEGAEAHVRRICEIAWSNGACLAGPDVPELVRELFRLPRYEEGGDVLGRMQRDSLGDYVRFDELVAVLKRFESKLEAGK